MNVSKLTVVCRNCRSNFYVTSQLDTSVDYCVQYVVICLSHNQDCASDISQALPVHTMSIRVNYCISAK